jgi:hypothetical protein
MGHNLGAKSLAQRRNTPADAAQTDDPDRLRCEQTTQASRPFAHAEQPVSLAYLAQHSQYQTQCKLSHCLGGRFRGIENSDAMALRRGEVDIIHTASTAGYNFQAFRRCKNTFCQRLYACDHSDGIATQQCNGFGFRKFSPIAVLDNMHSLFYQLLKRDVMVYIER